METYENATYKVTVNGSKVEIVKKAFNDRYYATLLENGHISANTALSLAEAMRARAQLGF